MILPEFKRFEPWLDFRNILKGAAYAEPTCYDPREITLARTLGREAFLEEALAALDGEPFSVANPFAGTFDRHHFDAWQGGFLQEKMDWETRP